MGQDMNLREPRHRERWACPVPRRRRRRGLLPFLLLAALLPGVLLPPWPRPAAAREPALSRRLSLPVTRIHVLDGDTFEADLNGDGRITTPAERVRLLYVDAPELHESHKGQDLAHGLPARDALARWLRGGPVRLAMDPAAPRGTYGRTLAVVFAGDDNLSLRLIRAGHSPFDTRFRLPAPHGEYLRYVAAEAEAFTARRGIWGDAASRRRYLARLKREQRTPQAAGNPLYHAPLLRAGTDSLEPFMGRYVRLRGTLLQRRRLGEAMFLLRLGGAGRARGEPVTAVIFPRPARRLTPGAWPLGGPLHIEGFVQRYRGRPQIALHYATRLPLQP